MPQNIIQVINRVESHSITKQLYGNIVLSGGNAKFRGMSERITKELQILKGGKEIVNVISPENKEVLSWVGGSILSCLSSF